MTFDELSKLLEAEIPKKISQHKGLDIFVMLRSKFEGWLKVEICNILSNYTDKIFPEKDYVDIVVDNWAIELKTVNTSYKVDGVDSKTKPLSKNINSVIKDINDLKRKNYKHKAVIFIVFPLQKSNKKWQEYKEKITRNLVSPLDMKEKFFKTSSGIEIALYCCVIKEEHVIK